MKKKLVPTKDRPGTSISMRIPVDLLEKLKRIAQIKEMSGYQSLIKYYIGQGLLKDADLVRQLESEDAEIDTLRLEAALRKVGLGPDKVEAFWKEWGGRPSARQTTTGNAGD